MKIIGTMNVGGELLVTDPCYISDSEHMYIWVPNVVGTFDVIIEKYDLGSWGERISRLRLSRSANKDGALVIAPGELARSEIGFAGVDSGQMMMIDSDAVSLWKDDSDSYGLGAPRFEGDKCTCSADRLTCPFHGEFNQARDSASNSLSYLAACNMTLDGDAGVLGDHQAAVSRTGMGDGSYPVITTRDGAGNLLTVEVEFISVEEFEDYKVYEAEHAEEVES